MAADLPQLPLQRGRLRHRVGRVLEEIPGEGAAGNPHLEETAERLALEHVVGFELAVRAVL